MSYTLTAAPEASWRSYSLDSSGPPVRFAGLVPSGEVAGEVFLGSFGAVGRFAYDSFALNDFAERPGQAALSVHELRAELAGAGRLALGERLGLTGFAGYGLARTVGFVSTDAALSAQPATWHGPWLGAGVQVRAAGFELTGGASLPLALAVEAPGGAASSRALEAQARLSRAVLDAGPSQLAVVLGYSYEAQQLQSALAHSAESAHAVCVGLALQPAPARVAEAPRPVVVASAAPAPPAPPAPAPEPVPEPAPAGGSVSGVVVRPSGAAVAGARVLARWGGGQADAASGPDGRFRFEGLPPGGVKLEAAQPGFRVAQGAVLVAAGAEALVELRLAPERPEPAVLRGVVRAVDGAPLAATLTVRGRKLQAQASRGTGAFSLQVPEGDYQVVIHARGYVRQTKAVSVRQGETVIFNVDLYPARRQ